jgi:oligopeptide transport system substrate-binding protein
MNRFMRTIFVILALSMLLTMVVGITSAQDEKIIVIADQPNDPQSIDPQLGINMRSWYLSNPLFPSLIILDEESNTLEPGIVTDWEVSENGLVTTFHLMENIPWVQYNFDTDEVEQVLDEDGNPRMVTAHDVYYGWMRALEPGSVSMGLAMLAQAVDGGQDFNAGEINAEDVGIRVVDDFTFEVAAPEVVGFTLNLYALMNARPTPQWAIEENGDSWIEPDTINCYGPYVLKEWNHEENMIYVRNPLWPGSVGYGQAQVDVLDFRMLDASVAVREYEAGNVHVILQVPNDQVPRLSADPVMGEELYLAAGVGTTAWGFNVTKAPFDNVHIRRAFSYAFDRESLVTNILQGTALPARWWTPPSINMAPTLENDADLGIGFDLEMAQSELALGLEALGLSSIDELPPITVVYRQRENEAAQAQALQVMIEETLGIRVELAVQDPTTYWANLAEDSGQLHWSGWGPDYNDASNFTRDVYRSDGIYNYGRFNSPEWDAMVDAARVEPDLEVRREMYRQIEQILIADEAAIIPSHWGMTVSLTKSNISRTYVPNGVQAFWKWDVSE